MSAVQLETRGVRLPAVGVTASCEWPVWLQRAPSGSSGRATTHLDSGSISPALILWILSLYQTQYAAKDDHKRLILSEVVRLQAPTTTSGLMLCWQLFYYLEYFPSPQLLIMTLSFTSSLEDPLYDWLRGSWFKDRSWGSEDLQTAQGFSFIASSLEIISSTDLLCAHPTCL